MKEIIKRTVLLSIVLYAGMPCIAQINVSNKISISVDYVPTQFDKKSEYWADAERRAITEKGLGLGTSINYNVANKHHISLALTKHRNTVETSYRDDDYLLYDVLDVFTFFMSGDVTSRDVTSFNQTVSSASYTLAFSYFGEKKVNNRTFLGTEVGLGVRTYIRDIHRTTSINGVITESENELKTETVTNAKVMLRLRTQLSSHFSFVGKVGISNMPLTLGLQYNL